MYSFVIIIAVMAGISSSVATDCICETVVVYIAVWDKNTKYVWVPILQIFDIFQNNFLNN
jgi:hypothetical protein